MSVRLDLPDIQGGILAAYGQDVRLARRAAHFLLHFESTREAREFLGNLVPHITRAHPPLPSEGLNVSITHSGFRALGVRREILDGFPEAFQAMSNLELAGQRAQRLGDVGASDPSEWEQELQTGTGHVHAIAAVHTESGQYDEARKRAHELLAAAPGVRVITVLETETQKGMVEHFGFADGASQPAVEGVVDETAVEVRGGGVALGDSRWRPVRPGEFILGYPDEDDAVVATPDRGLVANGSYVVWRKLEQRVGLFRKRLRIAAVQAGLDKELMAAKIVGRWRDGIPLEMAPNRDDLPKEANLTDRREPAISNDFRYLPEDRLGEICPRGAHIRRANPRDSIEFGTKVKETGLLTARHRIIRRGMPYGKPLLPVKTEQDDGKSRGLLFICFQSDIERQFEVIQGGWCCDGDAFFLGKDQDFLLGNQHASGKMAIPQPGKPPRFVETQPDLVVTRGMEYLFAPGLKALAGLADGRFS